MGARRIMARAGRLLRLTPSDILRRVSLRLYRVTQASSLTFPLLDGDVADSSTVTVSRPLTRLSRGERVRVGWVMTPPSPGSGGHTTVFRMIEELETQGHHCVVFLYDRFGGDLDERTEIIRAGWPRVRAEIRDARRGIDRVDAAVATSWDCAHVLAGADAPLWPFYFIQDFEPFFYGRGPEYELALDSYRFGFHGIALGEMVGELIRDEAGVDTDVVPFGCDTSLYRIAERSDRRSGVVFFARPDTPRRGYVLGKLALERFHAMCPDQEIHVFGTATHDIGVPVTSHGRLAPAQLNALYNRTLAGLSLSFTNVSLVPEEMLAAGTVPVVNESPYARRLLTNSEVVWARPTPQSLAVALAAVVRAPDADGRALRASSATSGRGWSDTARAVCRVIEEGVYGPGDADV